MRHTDDRITITTLPTGLTIAHRHRPGAAVDYCGVIVRAGSRDDDPAHHGMAHFVEHTIFKGTQKRSSWHIINRMERVGGELNAYTTKEETVVYTAAPRGNVARAFELTGDLVTSSRFPDSELDKEREVVCDEINSYLDIPSDAVYDDFEDMIFAGTTLGHNILGDEASVRSIDSGVCRRYLSQWYTAPNMTVFYYGALSPEKVAATVERHFSALPRHSAAHIHLPEGFKANTFDHTRSIGTHQSHTVMGQVAPATDTRGRFAMALITNILGGPGMNSLLNVSMREKRGLVYSVEATASMLSDCCLFTVYFGCDPGDNDRCKQIVADQIRALADTPMTERALNQAKKQYLGQLAVASENHESTAISTGRAVMLHGHVRSSTETIELTNSITPAEISEAAARIADLSTLTLT